MMASADELYITIKGRSGHAAMPHTAIDPIVVASQFVLALQTLVSRTLDPFMPGVLTIAKIAGGSTTNIIPDEVKLEGTLRAMDEEWRSRTHRRIEETLRGVCAPSGAEYDLEIRRGYPALTNDPWATWFAEEAARELFGPEQVYTHPPVMTAEDFAYYLQKVPGSFWWIGAGTPEQGCTAGLHNSHFTIDENILTMGSAMLAWLAYRYLVEGK
jgi:amidohydrolase/hippurate hydrolase